MIRHSVLVTLLATSTALAGVAHAAGAPAAAPQAAPQESAAQKAADRDVLRLSADGAEAFQDLHLARVAIFNADPAQAKALVGKAQAALTKARTDETAFTKAEADLKPPVSGKATGPGNGQASAQTNGPAAAAKSDAGAAPSHGEATKPVAWLPVDGQLTLGEDFIATPQKSAAVTDANKSLAKGDQKGAAETLKLAGIDVNVTMAVLPLDKTASDVDQAAQLLDQSKYYEANAILKQAEDGMRFDVVDMATLPRAAGAHAATKDGQGSSAADAAKPGAKPTAP